MRESDHELWDRLHLEGAEYADRQAESEPDPDKKLIYRQTATDMRRQLSTAPRQRYLGTTEIGKWFGVPGRTVTKWLDRYPDAPEPDVVIYGTRETPGWTPGREPEWRAWHAARPGHGWRKRTPKNTT